MDKTAFDARTREVLREESTQETALHWLSFADPEKPEGEQFLGVAIVRARGTVSAAIVAREHGVNPGGEMVCYRIANDVPEPMAALLAKYERRLLTKAEAEMLNAESRALNG